MVIYEEHIKNKFENGESLIDVEKRIIDFCEFLIQNYDDKHIAIISHKAPQFAFQVITEDKSWEQVILEDWRKTKKWQPGWIYYIDKEELNGKKGI